MGECIPEALGDVCEEAHFLRINPYAIAPERRFILALLEHALNDLQYPETSEESLRWFEDNRSYLPKGFSLMDCCQILQLEPSGVRELALRQSLIRKHFRRRV